MSYIDATITFLQRNAKEGQTEKYSRCLNCNRFKH